VDVVRRRQRVQRPQQVEQPLMVAAAVDVAQLRPAVRPRLVGVVAAVKVVAA
jgi:hypothetical protein